MKLLINLMATEINELMSSDNSFKFKANLIRPNPMNGYVPSIVAFMIAN